MLQYQVNNFQSIEKASITVKGFTLIIGQSNQGKSATLRALKAACTNRFKNGQVRHGEDHALIKVRVPDSDSVLQSCRPWNGSIKYKLGDQLFTKVGRTMPRQIAEFLNLGVLEAGSDSYSLNFHDQFQPPLLLAFSQPKVMELLSASTALQDLKDTHDALLIKRQENRGAIKSVQSLKDEAAVEVAKHKEILSKAEPLITKANSISDKVDYLNTQLEYIDSLLSEINALERVEDVIAKHETIVSVYDNLGTYNEVWNSVRELSDDITLECSLTTRISIHTKFIELYDPELDHKYSNLKMLEALQGSLSQIEATLISEESKNKLYIKAVGIESSMDQRVAYSNIIALESALSQLGTIEARIQEVKVITEDHVCPFCGSKVE